MSKKILSLALVVVMLFSMFAITSSAELSSGQVGLRLETNAKVGTPADSEVWVKFYIDVPESMNFAFNNITIAWNSAVYTPKSTNQTKVNDAITMGDSYADIFKGTGTGGASHTTTAGAQAIKNLTTEEQSYGWNKAVQFQLATLSGTYTSTTGFPVEPDYTEVLTMYFTTSKEITANDVIGFPMSDYGSTRIRLQTMTPNNTGSKALVDAANVVVTNAVPEAAPATPDVYELTQKTRAYEKSEGVYKTATFFGFKTIDPNFNAAGTSQYITDITAQVTIDGTPVAASDIPVIRYVYDLGNGEYGFRVILDNIMDGEAEIKVTPVVTTTDGKTFNVETVTFTAATAEAV